MYLAKKYNAVARAEQDVASSFVKGAAILTVSMVIVKVFGLLDKVILTNIYSMFGDASRGMGLYSNAFEIFVVIFTIATGGLPIAISRLISQNMTERRYKDVKLIHRISVPFFAIVGIVCLLIIVGASFPYAFIAIKSPYSIYAMVCLAPTVLFGCLASIYRGYFEGQRNMTPTAISEIIEACVKLVIGAALAYGVMKFGMDSYNSTGSFLFFRFANREEAGNTILAFSVAGAICGISLGSFGSFLFLFLKYKLGGDGIPKEYLEASIDARAKRETFATIVKTALPIVGGTLVMSLGSLVDQIIIQNVIFNLGKTNMQTLIDQYAHVGLDMEVFRPKHPTPEAPFTVHTALWGCYTSSLTLMQLVTAVTQVFGSSAMPNVTSSWTKGDKRELKRSMETVLKLTMMFTLPMALGLCVLSHEVMQFIYSDSAIYNIGGDVLRLMGITTIFTSVITPVCAMLNGIGKVKVPMILYIICMGVKVATTWMFVSIPSVNIQGATVGSMIGYGLICVIGVYLLIRFSGVKLNFFTTTVKPLIGAVASSVTAFFVNMLCMSCKLPQRLSTVIAIIAAAVIYLALLLILRTFSAQEVKILPKGENIAKTLEKLHLIG